MDVGLKEVIEQHLIHHPIICPASVHYHPPRDICILQYFYHWVFYHLLVLAIYLVAFSTTLTLPDLFIHIEPWTTSPD